jgi:hypothetical protein
LAHEIGHSLEGILGLRGRDENRCFAACFAVIATGIRRNDKDYRRGCRFGAKSIGLAEEQAIEKAQEYIRKSGVQAEEIIPATEIEKKKGYRLGEELAGIIRCRYPQDDRAAFEFLVKVLRGANPRQELFFWILGNYSGRSRQSPKGTNGNRCAAP